MVVAVVVVVVGRVASYPRVDGSNLKESWASDTHPPHHLPATFCKTGHPFFTVLESIMATLLLVFGKHAKKGGVWARLG